VLLGLAGASHTARSEELHYDSVCVMRKWPTRAERRSPASFLARAELVSTDVRAVDDHTEVWQTWRVHPALRGTFSGSWYSQQVNPAGRTSFPRVPDAAAPGSRGWLVVSSRMGFLGFSVTHALREEPGRSVLSERRVRRLRQSLFAPTSKTSSLGGSDVPPPITSTTVLANADWQGATSVELVVDGSVTDGRMLISDDGSTLLAVEIGGVVTPLPVGSPAAWREPAPRGPTSDVTTLEVHLLWNDRRESVLLATGTVIHHVDGTIAAQLTDRRQLPLLISLDSYRSGDDDWTIAWVMYPTLGGGGVGYVLRSELDLSLAE
jgi:hypothetical protein